MRTCDHSIIPVRPAQLGKPWCIFSANLSADALDDPIFPAGHPHYFGLAGGMIDAPDFIPAGSTLGHAMPAFPDSPQVTIPEFAIRGNDGDGFDMLIPLAFCSDAAIAALKADGWRITGRVVGGVPCLCARKS